MYVFLSFQSVPVQIKGPPSGPVLHRLCLFISSSPSHSTLHCLRPMSHNRRLSLNDLLSLESSSAGIGLQFSSDATQPLSVNPATQMAPRARFSDGDVSLSLHDFLVSFKYQQLDICPNNPPAPRSPRLVELAVPIELQLEELVEFPSLAEYAVDLVGETSFRNHRLSSTELSDLESGPRAHAINYPEIKCEGDSQHYYRGVFAFLVAFALNIADPGTKFSAREGTITPGNQNIPYGLHATTDILYLPARAPVEMKLPECLDSTTSQVLFGKIANRDVIWDKDPSVPGGIFHVVWPGPEDSLSVDIQGILQVYCQLVEEGRYFGFVSSYDHHLFVYRHPNHPKRLYVSRTYASAVDASVPKASALYTSVCFLKVASDVALQQGFHDHIQSMDGKLCRAPLTNPPNIYPGRKVSTSCVDTVNFPVPPGASPLITARPNRYPKRAAKATTNIKITLSAVKDLVSSTNSNLDNVNPRDVQFNYKVLSALRDERRTQSKPLFANKIKLERLAKEKERERERKKAASSAKTPRPPFRP
ncbi:hypothetical protein HGRIS_005560 [Hohenbuehelia grisea]|uniref:Uncharacterized protein n=1 Tax=Hohenbuehelia grisea TaxID=104357 RepID=A0ABR3JZH1_9AGAR